MIEGIAEAFERLRIYRQELEAAGYIVSPPTTAKTPLPLEFVFDQGNSLMSLNGSYFVKGFQAKLLRNILVGWIEKGRRDWKYFDLKVKRDIFRANTKKGMASNFEIHFMRLRELLEKECPRVQIQKTGRGRFEVQIVGVVRISIQGKGGPA